MRYTYSTKNSWRVPDRARIADGLPTIASHEKNTGSQRAKIEQIL